MKKESKSTGKKRKANGDNEERRTNSFKTNILSEIRNYIHDTRTKISLEFKSLENC